MNYPRAAYGTSDTSLDTATPVSNSRSKEAVNDFIPQKMYQPIQQFNEFVPGQNFINPQQADAQASLQVPISAYGDPFISHVGITNLDGTSAQINPYAQQASTGAQQYFQDTTSYKHPLNSHLYASIGPRRENLLAYQRSTTDFFIPDNLREDLQRKSESALQVFANSTLPPNVEYLHSLVALDTNTSKGSSIFGYPNWLYKGTSSRDSHTYCLRRIEGFRLSHERAIQPIQAWKRVSSGGLVQIHDAFTGKWFNDSSLIIVTDYHPLSQSLADKHFGSVRQSAAGRPSSQPVSENDLWMYLVQIASALKCIHENNLAAQTIVPSKVLVTSKNRLRLSGCGVIDVVQYDSRRPVAELQRTDLEDLGKLLLGIATRNQGAHQNAAKALELVGNAYTERLRSCIAWLLSPTTPEQALASSIPEFTISTLFHNIADKVVAAFDCTLHLEDTLTSTLMSELENGRIARLVTKLNVILERPETSTAPGTSASSAVPGSHNHNALNQPSASWSETGERYYLKLFRDYVFHQVDIEGRPVVDLGHILSCLNKLDAGIDEKIQLVSRDEQNVFIVSYREVKRGFEAAWAEISKASARR